MNARLLLIGVLQVFVQMILGMPLATQAQGFAGLGARVDGFALPQREAFAFPRDHGPHPDYRIEWWYITANLEGEDGRDYGVQWTLFRTAIAPREAKGLASPQMWMGHAAITSRDVHHAAERLARGGTGQAGVSLSPFKAWIDNWEMTGLAPSAEDLVSKVRLRASDQAFSYDLELDAKGPITPQGEGGYSVKSATGQASRYYSQPFYSVSGEIRIGAKSIRVSGQAWLDREWSSQPLAETQTGWDWFSLHLETGEKLMGFRLRDSGEGYTSGTWIAPDGAPSPLQPGDFQATPLRWVEVAGRRMPVEWRVRLPSRGLDIRTRPLNAEAWMALTVPYWEGPIRFEGTHPGRGYLEMTGYP